MYPALCCGHWENCSLVGEAKPGIESAPFPSQSCNTLSPLCLRWYLPLLPVWNVGSFYNLNCWNLPLHEHKGVHHPVERTISSTSLAPATNPSAQRPLSELTARHRASLARTRNSPAQCRRPCASRRRDHVTCQHKRLFCELPRTSPCRPGSRKKSTNSRNPCPT